MAVLFLAGCNCGPTSGTDGGTGTGGGTGGGTGSADGGMGGGSGGGGGTQVGAQFTLTATPNPITLGQAGTANVTVTVSRSGDTSSIAFTASGLTAGVTAAFTPTTTTGEAEGTPRAAWSLPAASPRRSPVTSS